ncbi:MAG: hypothetical protein M1824_004253 [Vezdaea acicularis]|nr:MAG: hypothetical protein M1824_004253 [Vezdaea acicularis]
MPYRFDLPTTSALDLHSYLTSTTHPSLPSTASSRRTVLRLALKAYKRLPAVHQPPQLAHILDALTEYLPYLNLLLLGSNGDEVPGEAVQVTCNQEIVVEWRPVLSKPAVPRVELARVKGRGLQYEIEFVLHTLGMTYVLLARQQLQVLYSASPPPPVEREQAVKNATKSLLQAVGVWTFIEAQSHLQRGLSAESERIAELRAAPALANMALAEANLCAVLKDDPYPSVVARERSKEDRDWMIMGQQIPRVRAAIAARICRHAGELAGRASASLAELKLEDGVGRYVDDLGRLCRARAFRFWGIDAEMRGVTGEAIAWLRAARRELGGAENPKGLEKLKRGWREKNDDRKSEKGDWGWDAGKAEEGRILDLLEEKWIKLNDTVNTQRVPGIESLLANLPTGMSVHKAQSYAMPNLDDKELSRMQAPGEIPSNGIADGESDSEDEARELDKGPPGTFPGNDGYY